MHAAPKKRPPSDQDGLFCSFERGSAKQGADDLLHEHRARVDLIEIAVPVIITVARIEVVAIAQIVRDLAKPVTAAISGLPALAAIKFLCLAWWHAAVVLLREPWRTAADPVSVAVRAIGMGVPVSLPIAGLGKGRSCKAECRSTRKQKKPFHISTILA